MGTLKFTVHTEGLDALSERLNMACTKAEHKVAVQVKKDTEDVVPKLNGDLRSSTKVVGNKIIYNYPYARYLYNGLVMVDPETGSSWTKKGRTKVVTSKPLTLAHAPDPQAQAHWFEASKAQNLDKWLRVAEKAVTDDF